MIRPRVDPFFRTVITVFIFFTFFCFIIKGKVEVTSILKAAYRSDLIKAEEPLFINVLRSTLKMLQRAKLGIKKLFAQRKRNIFQVINSFSWLTAQVPLLSIKEKTANQQLGWEGVRTNPVDECCTPIVLHITFGPRFCRLYNLYLSGLAKTDTKTHTFTHRNRLVNEQ